MASQQAKEPNELLPLLVERVRQGDVDGLVDLFENDAVLDTGAGLVAGSAAIREFWSSFVASGIPVEVGNQTAALVNGDLALTSTVMPDGGVTVEVARRQADGSWRWVMDQPSLPIFSE